MESTPISPIASRVACAKRGFTLIEMLVVLAIIGIITTVILTSQSNFNQTLVLNDTAYNIAFSARLAQSYGLSSRAQSAVQNTGYGLNFNRNTPTTYTFFADIYPGIGIVPTTISSLCVKGTYGDPDYKPGDCFYTAGGSFDKAVTTTTFTRGYSIDRICGISTNSTSYCSTSGTLDSANVVFLRPNTKTVLTGFSGSNLIEMSCIQVRLKSPTGGTSRTIRISQLGEISLNQFCAPLTF